MNYFFKNQSQKKATFYILIMFILSLGLSFSFQSLLAFTLTPTKNPLADNFFRKNALINENNTETSILVAVPLGVDGNFSVGTNALYVQGSTGATGVGTASPSTTLDVNGLFRPGNYTTSSRPACTSSARGMVIYDVNINRPIVCTNSGWLYF